MGESVKRGDLIALILSAGLENNFTIKLNQYRIAFEKSKIDYNRTRSLVEEQIVSQKDFLTIKSTYLQDSIRYFQWANSVSDKGLKITAPFDGYISEISVKNGKYIESGHPLIKVSNEDKLLIEAYVNQSDYGIVPNIFDAHFKITAEDRTITLKEINGLVKSSRAFVSVSTTRIPVTFTAVNNGKLIPGMFLEAYLLADKKENALVVPVTAIIEEQGENYVYVQLGGESYEKRRIRIDNYDGLQVEITSGIQPGERIVIKGAYQIRLAALAGDLPIHGHTH